MCLLSISDNAYIEAQKFGKSPALCAADSPFMTDLDQCQNCVVANSDSTNVSLTTYDGPEFAPFIEFCDSQANSSATTLISSQLSALSVAATVQATLSLKASEGSVSIVTQISTLISVSISTVEKASATSSKISYFITDVRGDVC
jgi:hypothetical protein